MQWGVRFRSMGGGGSKLVVDSVDSILEEVNEFITFFSGEGVREVIHGFEVFIEGGEKCPCVIAARLYYSRVVCGTGGVKGVFVKLLMFFVCLSMDS